MNRSFVGCVLIAPFVSVVLFSGLFGDAAAGQGDERDARCALQVQLVDAETMQPIPGLIQFRDSVGKRLSVNELLDRGAGLPADVSIHDWAVLPRPSLIKMPRQKLTVRAFSGLETEIATADLDLSGKSEAKLTIPLTRFSTSGRRAWQSANTHVHLRNTTRPESDRYLIECSQGDGLDVVFVSYLERPSEHEHYSTNNYTRRALKNLSNQHTHFGHGEEHRHNFTPWEEGYGHVMLLNIPELIHPVSIGPGITGEGTDGSPVRANMEKARSMGGHVIWCHNQWGLEDIPNWLTGHIDANNIFDGGTHGSYRHSFYRYLNIGLRVPFSTGTDWFMYDFSRVYVDSQSRLTPEQWLAHLAQGKSYITNGPLLDFSVEGKTLGDDVSLETASDVSVVGRAVGRVDFGKLEVVLNGRVVQSVESRPEGRHFRADLDAQIAIDQPSWLALRTPPPSAPDHGIVNKTPLNEYGHELFSHTSAIFVDIGEQRIFQRAAAQGLLDEMKKSRAFIADRAEFADDDERDRVLTVYDEAIELLAGKLNSGSVSR